MSQPTKPTSVTETKPEAQQPADKPLPATELEKVTGGVTTSEIHFTKLYDKSSPKLS